MSKTDDESDRPSEALDLQTIEEIHALLVPISEALRAERIRLNSHLLRLDARRWGVNLNPAAARAFAEAMDALPDPLEPPKTMKIK